MNGIEEVAVKVMILRERCERTLRTNTVDGVGNIHAEIYVVPCEYCEADACSEAVAEALKEEL